VRKSKAKAKTIIESDDEVEEIDCDESEKDEEDFIPCTKSRPHGKTVPVREDFWGEILRTLFVDFFRLRSLPKAKDRQWKTEKPCQRFKNLH